jgi:hypothetical protein
MLVLVLANKGCVFLSPLIGKNAIYRACNF